MSFTSDLQNLGGVVTVQIEGFFTERFINLCKINNVKIWDIKNLVKGVVRFKIKIGDFKKLKPIAKKTKCRVKIKKKEGLYFKLFKYRKRKLVIFLISLFVFFTIAFSCFIWQIDVKGNEKLDKDEVIASLKESGLYIGKCKIGLDKKEIINNLRINMQQITWAGIEIDGTKATLKIVEKTNLDSDSIQNSDIGDIVALKDGIITRIVPEMGTAMFNENSFVQKGATLIEGTMYSKILEPYKVVAKGMVRADCEYTYSNEYKFINTIKEYTNKKKYTIGISYNSKENMLNYLNKSKKYDRIKRSKSFNLFSQDISFDFYTCLEYIEKEEINTEEELKQKANEDIAKYLEKEIMPNTLNGEIKDTSVNYTILEDGIKVNVVYTVNEEIGKFVKSSDMVKEESYEF